MRRNCLRISSLNLALTDMLFEEEACTFNQKSHKKGSKNILNFLEHTDWPLGSPDLYPVDYDLWDYLE